MEQYHVDRCVLVQSSAFGWDNTYMVECLERFPGMFKAIGLVDPAEREQRGRSALLDEPGTCPDSRLHPLYYPDEPCWIDSPAHDALWDAAAETGAILQFHMWPRHAVPLARMIARHPEVRVIVDHLGKPDVTESAPYPSFQPVPRAGALPAGLGQDRRLPDRVARRLSLVRHRSLCRRAEGGLWPERMIWGTGYPGRARLVLLADALRYVREELPCLSASDVEQILGDTPRALFGF